MKLEQQVVSLELAQKLKSLGVKQESIFYWVSERLIYKTQIGSYFQQGGGMNERTFACANKVSAFTVAELGKLLTDGKHNFMPYYSDQVNEWVYNFGEYPDYIKADTEADARAKMIVYLLENKLITL